MRSLNSRSRRAHLAQLAGLIVAGLAPGSSMAAQRRIVCVGGALTEIVYALQAQGELVGVDTTSLYPPAATSLPNVGYARTLSAEGVLALSPSRLIATEDAGPASVLQQIGAAGVPLSILPANHRFEGVIERIERIGELLERQAAARTLADDLRQQWQRTRARIDGRAAGAKAPRVLFIMAHSSGQAMVGGAETAADAMLRYAGAANAITGFKGYKPMTPEAAVAAQPDIILVTDQGVQARGGMANLLALPGIGQTPAGRHKKIVSMEAMQLLGFGPRLPMAVSALHGMLTIPA